MPDLYASIAALGPVAFLSADQDIRGSFAPGGGCSVMGVSEQWQYAGISGASTQTVLGVTTLRPNPTDWAAFGYSGETSKKTARYHYPIDPDGFAAWNPSVTGYTVISVRIIQDYVGAGTTRRHHGLLAINEYDIPFNSGDSTWPLNYFGSGENDQETGDFYAFRQMHRDTLHPNGNAQGAEMDTESEADTVPYTGANAGPFLWAYGCTFNAATQVYSDFYFKDDGTVRYIHSMGASGVPYTPPVPAVPGLHLFLNGKSGSTPPIGANQYQRSAYELIMPTPLSSGDIATIAQLFMVQKATLDACPIPGPPVPTLSVATDCIADTDTLEWSATSDIPVTAYNLYHRYVAEQNLLYSGLLLGQVVSRARRYEGRVYLLTATNAAGTSSPSVVASDRCDPRNIIVPDPWTPENQPIPGGWS